MNIVRKIVPYVAVGSFVAAGACAGQAPPSPVTTASSTTPTDTAPPTTAMPSASAPDTTATATATATASAAPTATGPSMPAFQEPEPTKEKPKKAKKAIGQGKPKGLKGGAFEAYWVWFDVGGAWKLRTTTHDAEHRFQGVIVSEDGSISDVKPTKNEWNDRIKAGKDTISFDFTTKGQEDGLDFSAPEDRCIRFYLLIDGKPHVDRVNIGKGDVHPPHWHFQLCK